MNMFPCLKSSCWLSPLVALVFLMGCASTGPYGDRTAVAIYNEEPEDIIEAATAVFAANGFSTVTTGRRQVVFERAGTGYQNAAYGSWMGGSVWERATLDIEPYTADGVLLVADVRLVQSKDDSFFMDEKELSRRARKPFQEMLDEVARNLGGVPMLPRQ